MNENDHDDGQSSRRRPTDLRATAPFDDSDPTESRSAEMSHRLADWLEFIAIFEEVAVSLYAASVNALRGHSHGVIKERNEQPAAAAENLRFASAPHAIDEEKGVSR